MYVSWPCIQHGYKRRIMLGSTYYMYVHMNECRYLCVRSSVGCFLRSPYLYAKEKKASFYLWQLDRLEDGQTDGQTDSQTDGAKKRGPTRFPSDVSNERTAKLDALQCRMEIESASKNFWSKFRKIQSGVAKQPCWYYVSNRKEAAATVAQQGFQDKEEQQYIFKNQPTPNRQPVAQQSQQQQQQRTYREEAESPEKTMGALRTTPHQPEHGWKCCRSRPSVRRSLLALLCFVRPPVDLAGSHNSPTTTAASVAPAEKKKVSWDIVWV